MRYEVYCDESCIEALFDSTSHKFSVIGGVWIPAETRPAIKAALFSLKAKYQLFGEMKWNKISPASFNLYKDLVDLFFASPDIRFRSIVIDASEIDHVSYNQGSGELGFYKFYYELLHNWLVEGNTYNVFLDYKVNGNRHRVKELERVLQNGAWGIVKQAQSLPSDESLLIQLADVLTGAVAAAYNKEISSQSKKDIKTLIDNHIGHPIRAIFPSETKFNVFRIKLQKKLW